VREEGVRVRARDRDFAGRSRSGDWMKIWRRDFGDEEDPIVRVFFLILEMES